MKKFGLYFSILLIAAALVSVSVSAAENVVFVDVLSGKAEYSGLSPDKPKASFGNISGNQAMSVLGEAGGTMVVTGKTLAGGNYTFPAMTGPLTITSLYDGIDYRNPLPADNPASGSFKAASGITLTLGADTTFTDIILFQEAAQNTIRVPSGLSLTLAGSVILATKSGNAYYWAVDVDEGGTLYCTGDAYEKLTVTGEGTVVVDGKPLAGKEKDPKIGVANALYFLGLVKGYDEGGNDFGLDKNPNRAEAIVQIVRFLGAEEEALAGSYSLSFTDIPDWALPYIGYAYTNGITSGRSDTLFDPASAVDGAQFLTLLLRAMEYSDKDGDFAWDNPFSMANELGLVQSDQKPESFLRGDAFTACYHALGAKVKSGARLEEKLTAAGVVTERALAWAERVAGGETLVVACVGDSITEGYGASDKNVYSYPAQLQKLLGKGFKVINCGKSASYVLSPESAYNVKKEKPELWYPNTSAYQSLMTSDADIVIVMLGTNDARSMTAKAAEEEFIADYKSLIEDIRGMKSSPEIYLSTMLPSVNGIVLHVQSTTYTLPDLIRSIGNELNLPVIETGSTLLDYCKVMLAYSDRLHPTDDSYPALAIHFYNSVFGCKKALPEIPTASGNVVFVSNTGSFENSGKSPEDAVDRLGTAVAMLRERGGTVVVSGPLTMAETYLVPCGGPVTITSVYDGVDYRARANAKLSVNGNLHLASDLVIEALDFYGILSSAKINCCYHNLTVGEGVTWTAAKDGIVPLGISAGYMVYSAVISPALVSCHADCQITINSGVWSLFRGGNYRGNDNAVIGTIDENARVSICINGGEFTLSGAAASAACGMNACAGEIYLEVNGGNFKGDLFGLHALGGNTTGKEALFDGTLTVKLTGGDLQSFGLYHTKDTPKLTGIAKLILSESMAKYKSLPGFTSVEIIK